MQNMCKTLVCQIHRTKPEGYVRCVISYYHHVNTLGIIFGFVTTRTQYQKEFIKDKINAELDFLVSLSVPFA